MFVARSFIARFKSLSPLVVTIEYERESLLSIMSEVSELRSLCISLIYRWSKIAAKLPGRTDNEIKNHWHTHLKKRAKENQVSSEVKEHPSDISQCETISRSRDSEAESVPANAPSRHILESSPLSPETSSSYYSTLSFHHQAPPLSFGINQIAEDGVASSETFDEFIGDFWTEPFVADSTFFQNSCPLSLLNRGLISPCVSYYDDDIDLFYQVM